MSPTRTTSTRTTDQRDALRSPALSERQVLVLRAIVASYVGGAAAVGSRSVSHVLPVALSSASIRNTMAELTELGLIEKAHVSAGRVPTPAGLRCFVDHLVPRDLDEFERRDLAGSVGAAGGPDAVIEDASKLLSERTRQLGFVVAPRADALILRHVALVRLSTSRVLVVLVSQTGTALRRVIDDDESGDQAELERLAAALNERVAGRTLAEARDALAREVGALRSRARTLFERALWLGWRAIEAQGDGEPGDLVIATRLALLDQPEFQDPTRVKQLFSAIEAKESLLRILHQMIDGGRVTVAFGEELAEPELRQLALVAAPYGERNAPLGVLGVIGPRRMDYPRVVALVRYLGTLVTERLTP